MEPIQWGDHCIGLVCSLAELYKNAEFIDCELDTEGGLLKGQRVILAACSPYLKKLLMEHEGRRTVPLKQVKYKDMKYILDFIYNGEVGVPVAGMASFMETANFLKISSLRSCLSPNAFRKILSEVPVEQLVRCSGSENSIDLSKYCERNSPIEGDMKRCHKMIYSQKDDDLQIVSDCDKKSTDDLEQVSLRVNDAEMEADILKTEVIKENLMDEKDDNSQGVSHSTSFSPLSPASVKIKEDAISDSDDANLNVEEYSFGCDDTEENASEGMGRILESESRMKIGERLNQDIDYLSKTKSGPGQVPFAQRVNNMCGEAQNVELADTNYKEESDGFDATGGLLCSNTSLAENVSVGKGNSGEEEQQRHVCDFCEAAFKSRRALDRHTGTHPEEKPFACEVCGKVYKQRSYLVYHMRTHTGEKPYACRLCQAAYRNKSKLNVHMRTHTGERPFACSICGKSFFLKHHLVRHIRGHTGERPYPCPLCGKAFRDDGALSAHKRIHLGEQRRRRKPPRSPPAQEEEKPFACSVCLKAFARKVYLQTHMVTHEGRKAFLCSTCGKAFTQKSTLNMHSLIHTGVKSCLCSVCGKSFLIPHQLKRHMLIHTGEKPHRCSVCGKFFSDKGNLKAHMAIHTGAKHYRCCVCDESFNRRSELKKHMVTHKEQEKSSQ